VQSNLLTRPVLHTDKIAGQRNADQLHLAVRAQIAHPQGATLQAPDPLDLTDCQCSAHAKLQRNPFISSWM
jgi:hypothetical protein